MASNPAPASKTRVRDFGTAKHRHASLASTLKRSSMYFEAVVQTAVYIKRTRAKSSREAKIAEAFAVWINGERAILMSMLADYYHEICAMLRYCQWQKA